VYSAAVLQVPGESAGDRSRLHDRHARTPVPGDGGGSLILLGLAVYLFRVLVHRFSIGIAVALSTAVFAVVFAALISVLPSLGDLPANVEQTSQFGFARAATETPQPITNILQRR